MKKLLSLSKGLHAALLVSLTGGSISACGQFTNEDLVFLNGVPTRQEVALVVQDVPGGTPGALVSSDAVGDPAEYYILAQAVAGDLNASVGELLTFVDEIGRAFPPTTRMDNRRIWGPIPNVDGTGITTRVEIARVRDAEGDTPPEFQFCVHAGFDQAFFQTDLDCTVDDGGLFRLLAGTYTPRRIGEGPRSGMGDLFLNLELSRALGSENPEDRGLVSVEYDFADGGDAKQIHVDWFARSQGLDEAVAYDYGRSATGFIDFSFQVASNVTDGSDPTGNTLEFWVVNAAWQEGGLGRAEAVAEGGDLPPGERAIAVECWGADVRQTYVYLELEQSMFTAEEGDPTSCPPAL